MPHTSRTGAWRWAVHYDAAKDSGIEDSSQAASDAANQAWPHDVEKAARIAAREAWQRRQLDLIAKAEAGELSPDSFGLEEANYENLMWTMDQIRRRPRTEGLLRLIDTLSREFFRRRTGTGS